MLDRFYEAVYSCLPNEYKPSDCRKQKAGRCPAISNCAPTNGFIDANGQCAEGLYMVTKSIIRTASDECFTAWGLQVDLYLFPPCNKGQCAKPSWLPEVQWQLLCCLTNLNVNDMWAGGRGCGPLDIRSADCIEEGVCRGVKTSFTIPVP
jgi:hypothetical protein